jgi:hypothetical protein
MRGCGPAVVSGAGADIFRSAKISSFYFKFLDKARRVPDWGTFLYA